LIGRNIKSFFMQRLQDDMYILLFPTGLLMMVGMNPFSLFAKTQLNIKRDDTIIDFSYCKSLDNKNHCIWMLDNKLQVWKCSNELNPNQFNWEL
jgi:hypothetical protein